MEEILRKKFLESYKIYESWGKYVLETIRDEAKDQGIKLRFPPSVRVKEIESFLEKALYRKKNYKDPFNEIEDKVGVRFYVLLEKEINKISSIIEKCDIWNYSKDRDYFQEMIESPVDFNYKSVHYVLKNKNELFYNDIIIPQNTACEIQIRTLLQHAHCELMHDTVYKSKTNVKSEIRRIIAKSCVLIEVADEFFGVVDKDIIELAKDSNTYFEELLNLFTSNFSTIKSQINKRINMSIINLLNESKIQISIDELSKFVVSNNEVIKNNINKKNILSSQPVLLLLYYCVQKYTSQLREIWIFGEDE
ncbi:MAG: hypothetical protein K8S23_08240 [Candidatus Cloacimonetes bacterium]|nr:hypothetical protein [Candidatus Cloacimonadota bacterium]